MTKILVIDDEDSLRESIAQILTFEGFEVITAINGIQGLSLLAEHTPDLVVSDITMPEIDGYQVLLALRNNPLTASIPLIFLTARADRPFMRHGMELGADDYVTKPFTNAELLATVRTRLDRQQNIMDTVKNELTPIKQRLGRLISHELRTPLASITMVQELMSKQWGQMSIAQIQDLLDMMRLGSQRLSHMIEQTVIMNHLDSHLISEKEIHELG
ncbi:MAG: response regulator, partial [Chloroflexota bacterium]